MPYIKDNFREMLDSQIDALAEKVKSISAETPNQTRDGLMNYAITRMLNNIYADAKYHDMNELIGMLECCKLEFYRKTIGPYEDEKEAENGPVKKFNKDTDTRNKY